MPTSDEIIQSILDQKAEKDASEKREKEDKRKREKELEERRLVTLKKWQEVEGHFRTAATNITNKLSEAIGIQIGWGMPEGAGEGIVYRGSIPLFDIRMTSNNKKQAFRSFDVQLTDTGTLTISDKGGRYKEISLSIDDLQYEDIRRELAGIYAYVAKACKIT